MKLYPFSLPSRVALALGLGWSMTVLWVAIMDAASARQEAPAPVITSPPVEWSTLSDEERRDLCISVAYNGPQSTLTELQRTLGPIRAERLVEDAWGRCGS